jgi:hypothetical protein
VSTVASVRTFLLSLEGQMAKTLMLCAEAGFAENSLRPNFHPAFSAALSALVFLVTYSWACQPTL